MDLATTSKSHLSQDFSARLKLYLYFWVNKEERSVRILSAMLCNVETSNNNNQTVSG